MLADLDRAAGPGRARRRGCDEASLRPAPWLDAGDLDGGGPSPGLPRELTRRCNTGLRRLHEAIGSTGAARGTDMPYMFNRSARLGAGTTLDSMAWAVKITEKVNNVTGSDTSLWTTSMSPQVGLLSWNTIVEDYAELMTANDKLMADSGYLDLLEEGA